ncbi:YcjX family protein [Salmonella enterica subsp. enterica serovar Enteritidis]|nr:YcjX family protein [Salmonella enterica subsp. enterica serovar Enteritidis]
MKRLKTELNALVNRGVDRHLRLAVTGLSRSGKTAFITAMVNQLLNVHAGARLPLLSAVREERLLGVKRVPQRDFGIPRFTYDEGILQLYGNPPAWPTPTRGVSEIRLALRYRSNDSLLRHFKDTSTLYLEIVDYPGEWLLDLPMLAQDYLSWSRQMNGLLQGQRAEWAAKWRQLCDGLDPLAPADENRLAEIAAAWTDYLHQCKSQADKQTNAGMLRERFNYYCEKVVKGFYKNHFLRFDRQIVLVDCLQPLNSGPQAFNDMRLALTQLMQSFHYGQRTLFRRLFSPVIDKLLFAATKADHVTLDQHANMVALLQQLIQDAWQNAAFEGISMDCLGLASVQATTSGVIEVNGEKIPALRGNRLSDGAPLTVYPGEVPSRLPGQAFWDSQGFQFEAFRPQVMDVDKPLPHIRLDAALEFLIGDKLR